MEIGIIRITVTKNEYLYNKPDKLANILNEMLAEHVIDVKDVINVDIDDTVKLGVERKIFTVFYKKPVDSE